MAAKKKSAPKKRQAKVGGVIEQAYELVPIDSVQPHPRNVNQGDQGAIFQSIQHNGFIGAAIVQRSTGNIVAGKHRWLAAKQSGIEQFPVIYADIDDETALRYMLADNRTSRLGTDDPAQLAELLESIRSDQGSLKGTGFDDGSLNELLESLGRDALKAAEAPEAEIDRAEELLKKWKVKRGQVWQTGRHRLMCGDCTSQTDVDALMQGQKAGLMNTDPPYGVSLRLEDNHSASNSAKGISKTYRHFEKIMGDDLEGDKLQAFLESCFRVAITALTPNAAWYLWHAQLSQGFFAAAAAAAQLLVHRQIIWAKPHFVFGRGDYHWQHELCFYGWIKGNRPAFYGERNQSTVWMIKEGGGSIRKDQNHPTQKPVELFAIPLRNHTKPGELCYEPFAGSGSQFVAAEQLDRICYGLEIEPKYCSVILERLSQMGVVGRLAEAKCAA